MNRDVLRSALLVACLNAAACSASPPMPATAGHPPSGPVAPLASPTLPFHEGGLGAALADARRLHKLVFVDLWATWCPPCMAMRAWAFGDLSLRALADSFVWVAVDRDSAEGEELVTRWGVTGLPTLLVLDPDTSAPRASWSSTPLSGPEVAALLRGVAANPLPEGAADVFSLTRVLQKDDATGRAARARVEALLEHLTASSPLTPFLVEELIASAQDRHDFDRCVQLAEAWSDRLPAASIAVDVAFTGEACADQMKPPRTVSARHQLDRAQSILESPDSAVLPWRRGYALFALRGHRLELGDAASADEVMRRWQSFLRTEWARSGVAQRASLSAPEEFWLDRLGDYTGAADALADITRESPHDVDALRRWAEALQAAGRIDEGIAAIENGVGAITPEGRLPALWEQAVLLRKKSDAVNEAALLDAALSLPRGAYVAHRFASLRAQMEERRGELRTGVSDGGVTPGTP